jgi:uncharacterized small protein (DUF1192 family)
MAEHPKNADGSERTNRLAIPISEVERLLKERKKYDYSKDEQQDVSVLVARITILEQEVARLKQQRIETPERAQASATQHVRPVAPQRPVEPRSITPEPVQSLSGESVSVRIFTRDHGLKPRTVSDHIHDGKIKATPRENTPPGQDKWFFSPEEQRDAVKYWRENHTKGFHPCEHCPHEL